MNDGPENEPQDRYGPIFGPEGRRRSPTDSTRVLRSPTPSREMWRSFGWFTLVMVVLAGGAAIGVAVAPCDPNWFKGDGDCPQLGFAALLLLLGVIWGVVVLIVVLRAIGRGIARGLRRDNEERRRGS